MNQENENPETTVDAPSAVNLVKARVTNFSHLIGYGDPKNLTPLHRSMLADKIRERRNEGAGIGGESVAFSRGVCMS